MQWRCPHSIAANWDTCGWSHFPCLGKRNWVLSSWEEHCNLLIPNLGRGFNLEIYPQPGMSLPQTCIKTWIHYKKKKNIEWTKMTVDKMVVDETGVDEPGWYCAFTHWSHLWQVWALHAGRSNSRTAVSVTIFWLKEKELTPRLFNTVKLQLRHYKSTKVRLIGRSGVRINFWMMPIGVFSGYSTLKFRMMCAIAMCSSSSATRRPVEEDSLWEEGRWQSIPHSPTHMRGPNPKDRELNACGVSLFSLLHRSGMKRSGSGKICGSLPVTRWTETTSDCMYRVEQPHAPISGYCNCTDKWLL